MNILEGLHTQATRREVAITERFAIRQYEPGGAVWLIADGWLGAGDVETMHVLAPSEARELRDALVGMT